MTTESREAGAAPPADAYLDLVRAFPLRPIRNTSDHDRAIEVVNSLAGRRGTLRPEEHDYFLVLCLLIERYESEIYPDPTES
jgi:HTH-type transcriptional regulator / antitoxin HigA